MIKDVGKSSDIAAEDKFQVGDVSLSGHFVVGSDIAAEGRRIAGVIRHDLGIADELRLLHSFIWTEHPHIFMNWVVQNKHGKNFTLLLQISPSGSGNPEQVAQIAQAAADYFRDTQ